MKGVWTPIAGPRRIRSRKLKVQMEFASSISAVPASYSCVPLSSTRAAQIGQKPVAKGETGGDIVQTINARAGASAGVILWELKNTKTWSDTWLPKLRDNKRAAKADVALIVSAALPKGVETFDLIDGVYVAHARCAVPVALTLRQGLLEIANARTAQQGQQSKAEQVYNYLTGSRFKQRIEAVVERFKEMRDDIDKERKFMTKAWAKREAQVIAMVDSTVGMVGDLHGIIGQAMPEISVIDEPPMLEGKAA